MLGVSTSNQAAPGDILTPEAIDMLAIKLRTPLQVQLHLTLAREAELEPKRTTEIRERMPAWPGYCCEK